MEMNALSYIHRPVDFYYCYQTVPERLQFIAEKYGDKEVYVFLLPDGRREVITAAELYEKSCQLAHSLISLGIGKGDIVATCLYNDLDLLICTFGIIFSGAIVLNTLIVNEDGSELHGKLQRQNVKCLILHPGEDNEQFRTCMKFIHRIERDGSVESQTLERLEFLVLTAPINEKEVLQLKDLLQDHDGFSMLPRLDPEMTIALFPTSGSTGESKLVPHSHHDAMILGHHLKESIGYETDDILYTERRIAWIGGFPFMLLHDGVKVVTKTRPFDSLREHCKFTHTAMEQENCTIACLLPATITGILELMPEVQRSQRFVLKNINVGGLPISSVCMNAIGVLSEMVTNLYGSSELGAVTSNHVKTKENYITYSTGRPYAGVEVKVVDTAGLVVKRGEVGNVHVRSPCIFAYYNKDEAKTKEVLSVTRWMDTDDVGYITEDGQLIVEGRRSDIILQNGLYMVPSQIEDFIKTHPDVADVAVVPIPDDSAFEIACACVNPLPGRLLTAEEINDFYAKRVISYAHEAFSHNKPELIIIFESFPTHYTGKPNKIQLKKEVLLRLQKQEH